MIHPATIPALTAAALADALPWLVPLVIVVASAAGFGAAAYFWGRNSRIERYLNQHKDDTTTTNH